MVFLKIGGTLYRPLDIKIIIIGNPKKVHTPSLGFHGAPGMTFGYVPGPESAGRKPVGDTFPHP